MRQKGINVVPVTSISVKLRDMENFEIMRLNVEKPLEEIATVSLPQHGQSTTHLFLQAYLHMLATRRTS